MNYEIIKEKVRLFLEDGTEISEGTDLTSTGILDSFNMIRLLTFIEEEFKITIDLEEINIEEFSTIGSITKLVDKWVSGNKTPNQSQP